jgi:hypothetical protein
MMGLVGKRVVESMLAPRAGVAQKGVPRAHTAPEGKAGGAGVAQVELHGPHTIVEAMERYEELRTIGCVTTNGHALHRLKKVCLAP